MDAFKIWLWRIKRSKFFNPFKNTYTFFQTYANIDKVDPRNFKVEYKDLEEIDKWLLSKYNRLVKNVTEAFEEYDLNKVVKYLTTFVGEDLSNWYIRRNRNRFWGSVLDNSKKSVYQTTYEVLIGLSKLLAPISPYISEEIYQNLTNEESVHLSSFPKCDESLIDLKLEEKMDLVRDIISLGRNAREEAKIKVRQPISEVLIDGKNKDILKDFSLTIYPGDKIALIGPNEIAKTTLLNILAGKLDPDSGKITVGSNDIISYYPKNHEEYFASNQTLLEWLRNYSENKDETFVRGFLGRMLFSGEDALKNVKVLSGGEKVRAMFSKLMLNRGNVLLLDEPTNHLDIEAITSLNDGLEKFLGVLVFSSFDQELIETVSNRLIEIKSDGTYKDKRLSYQEYIEKFGLGD